MPAGGKPNHHNPFAGNRLRSNLNENRSGNNTSTRTVLPVGPARGKRNTDYIIPTTNPAKRLKTTQEEDMRSSFFQNGGEWFVAG